MCFPIGSRSLAKRQQPDSRFRSGTFGSNLGRNCLPDYQRRARFYSERFGRGAIVTKLTTALMVRSLGVTKKLAFQFENILPIRCSPTFYSIVRSALKNVAGFLRFRSREAEIQAPAPLSALAPSFRESRGVASNARPPQQLRAQPRRNPITQAVLVGIEKREAGLSTGSEPIA